MPKATAAVDQMDTSMSKLRVIWIALQSPSWIDNGALLQISETLDQAIRELEPIRAALNKNGMEL